MLPTNYSSTNHFYFKLFSLVEQSSISMLLVLFNLSGATIPGHSGPGSDGNEGLLCIPQSSSITGTSSSDCLVSYPGHSLGGSYPSAEVHSVYSKAPANWASKAGASPLACLLLYPGHLLWGGGLTSLQRYNRCILQLWLTGLSRLCLFGCQW